MSEYLVDDILSHHGIGGMKWGKRNGPPYPLSGKAHSLSERKAGKKGWTKEAKKEKLKKIGKVAGATVGIASAAAVGGIATNKKIKDSMTHNPNHKRTYKPKEEKVDRKYTKAAKELKKATEDSDFNFGSKDDIKNLNRVVSGTVGSTAKALREASKTKVSTGIKPASEMSNKELQEFLNRKSLEERYEKYTTEVKTNKKLSAAADALETIGGLAITALSAYALYRSIKKPGVK